MNELTIQIKDKTFRISLFCAQKVGDTENMKFRLKCDQNPEMNQDFDDYTGLSNFITFHLHDTLASFMDNYLMG